MRHRKAGRKFGMNSTARKAMYRNMVTSLLLHGQIKTTTERAKELRRYADRLITLGKGAPTPSEIGGLSGDEQQEARAARVHAIRRARLWVNNDEALGKLFGEYADRFATRPGGYTRIVKAGYRAGDNASMAVIQLVEALEASEAGEVPDAEEPLADATVDQAPADDAVADEDASDEG